MLGRAPYDLDMGLFPKRNVKLIGLTDFEDAQMVEE